MLFGVAATSARSAWAVGVAGNPGSLRSQTLILRWTGTAWTRVPSPAPGAGGALNAVAATSARNAVAVGATSHGQPLFVRWTGAAWIRVPGPRLPRGSDLISVAATSARNAWAVGSQARQQDPHRALERCRLEAGAQPQSGRPQRRAVRRGGQSGAQRLGRR